jgi:hypothetical protein
MKMQMISPFRIYNTPEAMPGFHLNMVSVYAGNAVPTTAPEKDLFSRCAVILRKFIATISGGQE